MTTAESVSILTDEHRDRYHDGDVARDVARRAMRILLT